MELDVNIKDLEKTIDFIWAKLIINELYKSGHDYFVISPGYRSTPFVVSLMNFKQVQVKTCIDERASAYIALGYARATGKVPVLICTSGTALANYLPAVIESFKERIPLIILSSDRPREQTFSDSNQTIDQSHIFRNYVKMYYGVPSISEDVAPEVFLSQIGQLVALSRMSPRGSIHINCFFNDPESMIQKGLVSQKYFNNCEKLLTYQKAYSLYLVPEWRVSELDTGRLVEILNHSQSGLIIVGKFFQSHLNGNNEPFLALAQKLDWPIYFDITSSLKGKYPQNIKQIPDFDHKGIKELFIKNPNQVPSTIIHFGDRLVSKHFYEILKQYPNINYIVVNDHPFKQDPTHQLTIKIQTNPLAFAQMIFTKLKSRQTDRFFETHSIERYIDNFSDCIDKIIRDKNEKISHYSMVKTIFEYIEEGSGLYLANSITIRTFELLGAIYNKKNLSVGSNRGASGIEGFLASTVGYADGLKNTVTLVLGDVAFLHDLNSLLLLKQSHQSLCIIIINNNGGGIFSRFPVLKEKDEIFRYFKTPHDLEGFKSIIDQFNLPYHQVSHIDHFEKVYSDFINLSRSQTTKLVIEIVMDEDFDLLIHRRIQNISLL